MATLLSSLSSDQQLELIYVGYYGRAAEPAGFVFWEGQYAQATANGQSMTMAINNIANSFGSSTQMETTSLYPFLSNPNPNYSSPVVQAELQSFVQSVYQNLFNRSADPAGLAYWTNAISSGQVGLGQAVLDIANGAQAGSSDYQLLSNKVMTALQFTTQTAGIQPGEPMTASYSAEAHYVLTLDTSAAPPAGTQAASTETSNFVAGNGSQANGSVINIVSTQTNYIGSTGNDTFIANNSATGFGATLNLSPADTIAGNGGNDTLKIYSNATANGVKFTSGQITGISNLYVNNLGAQTLDVTGIVGLKNVQLDSIGGNGTVNLNGQALTISNDTTTAHTITINSAVDTAESVTLSSVGSTAIVDTLDFAGALVTSATLTGSGTAADNVIVDNTTGSKLATLNLAGSAALTVAANASDVALKTINGSTATGNLTVHLENLPTQAGLSFTGGSGVDSLYITQTELDALTSGSQLNGGTGSSNNLWISAANGFAQADYTSLNATTHFSTLGFAAIAGATTVDASKLTSIMMFADAGGATLTINNLANSGETVTDATTSGLVLSGSAGGSTVGLNLGLATSTGQNSEFVTDSGNITVFNVTSNGVATAENIVQFTNTGTTTYNVSGSVAIDITAVGGTTAKAVNATASTGAVDIGVDTSHAGFAGFTGGDTVTAGTSGLGDSINLGAGASIVVEKTVETAAANPFDTITLAGTHAASTIAADIAVDGTFSTAANLELVKGFTLGQDSVAISTHASTAATAIGGGLSVTSKGFVTASSLAVFEGGLGATTPTAIGQTFVWADTANHNTYVAESTAAAGAGHYHVIELMGVTATTGVTVANGVAVIS